jgi:hypothetical protein
MGGKGNGIPREEKMRAFRVMACIAVIASFVGASIVGDALAGEKFKLRTVKYMTKWEQVNVGDEEGHCVAIGEAKGVVTNKEGKWFGDGWVLGWTATFDINPKVGSIVGGGYEVVSDRDGDKWWRRWEGKALKENYWEGKYTIVSGTGKFEGIKGKGNWSVVMLGPNQFYSDEEWDIELPKR